MPASARRRRPGAQKHRPLPWPSLPARTRATPTSPSPSPSQRRGLTRSASRKRCRRGDQQRLQADDQRREPGLQARAGSRRTRRRDRRRASAARPRRDGPTRAAAAARARARPGPPATSKAAVEREAQRQEGHRLGVRHAQPGADEAGAPQQHEQSRAAGRRRRPLTAAGLPGAGSVRQRREQGLDVGLGEAQAGARCRTARRRPAPASCPAARPSSPRPCRSAISL